MAIIYEKHETPLSVGQFVHDVDVLLSILHCRRYPAAMAMDLYHQDDWNSIRAANEYLTAKYSCNPEILVVLVESTNKGRVESALSVRCLLHNLTMIYVISSEGSRFERQIWTNHVTDENGSRGWLYHRMHHAFGNTVLFEELGKNNPSHIIHKINSGLDSAKAIAS